MRKSSLMIISFLMLVFNVMLFKTSVIQGSIIEINNLKDHRLKSPTTQAALATFGDIEWSHTYGGPATEYGKSVIQTSDGGYALTGRTDSYGAGLSDMWLVKTDAQGIMQWNRTYGGIESEYPSSLIQTTDGGFVLAGDTHSYGAGHTDIWLVKTDAQGVMQWYRTYGGELYEYAWALIQTTDGGFAVVGNTGSNRGSPGDFDIWLVKTDENGVVQWNRTYGNRDCEAAYGAIQTSDEGFILVGRTKPYFTSKENMWVVKTDSKGIVRWNLTYGGADDDRAWAVIQTVDGGFAIAGWTQSFSAGWADMWLIKTDVNGSIQWNRTYGGVESEETFSIVQTADGGFVLAGNIVSYAPYDVDILLVKTDGNGIMEWNRTYGDLLYVQCVQSLIQTTDEGFALIGYRFRGGTTPDMLFMKIQGSPTSKTIHNDSKSDLSVDLYFIFFLISVGIIGYLSYKRKSVFSSIKTP